MTEDEMVEWHHRLNDRELEQAPGASDGRGSPAQCSPWRCTESALTIQSFVGKVMSLVFNMLSRLVIAFLLRHKHLLISWLQSPSAVILEPQNKVSHCFHCFPIYLP